MSLFRKKLGRAAGFGAGSDFMRVLSSAREGGEEIPELVLDPEPKPEPENEFEKRSEPRRSSNLSVQESECVVEDGRERN